LSCSPRSAHRRTIGCGQAEAVAARAAVVRPPRTGDDATLRRRGPLVHRDSIWILACPIRQWSVPGIEEVLAARWTPTFTPELALARGGARLHLTKRMRIKSLSDRAARRGRRGRAPFSGGVKQASAMLASHMMSNAIAQLHGVTAAKRSAALRTAGRRAGADPDENCRSIPINGEVMTYGQRLSGRDGCTGALFASSSRRYSTSPDPAALVARPSSREGSIRLSTLFSAVHFDREARRFIAQRRRVGEGRGRLCGAAEASTEGEAIRRNRLHCAIRSRGQVINGPAFPTEGAVRALSTALSSRLSSSRPSDGFPPLFPRSFGVPSTSSRRYLETRLRHVLKT